MSRSNLQPFGKPDRWLAAVSAEHNQRRAELATQFEYRRDAMHKQVSLTNIAQAGIACIGSQQQFYTSLVPHMAALLNTSAVNGSINVIRMQQMEGDW